jgi:hypothetical protein
MKKFIIILAHWFARTLNRLAASLESTGRSAVGEAKFVDLAPTDKADKTGIYSEAILFATNNMNVTNIALTGPYGSGKSSIIHSFVKRHRPRALHISLAAFVPEAGTVGGTVNRQEIERSILQQMLFGADANKLPLSRFKRIQSPSVWSIFQSLYIMLGILSLWFVFLKREEVIDGTFFSPLAANNLFNLGSFAIAVIFLWVALHYFYVASFGVSLKSISLKDIEIEPSSKDRESILNRHLDEIIYFFQSTDYDLVIIEDLDRFDDTEIFVTLREINSLVNANAGVKRTIRFLYALRDDMFANTDRTKFFEFIIPVIPIINTSNSIDMVLEQGRRLELDERLDRQFLREVSRYLNDLRLIQNIFNEYAIYVANLETDEENLLNANKLLAILIYKNVYPKDFEQLHRGGGYLAGILSRQDEFKAHGEAVFRAEIAELEQEIRIAEAQTPSDLKELRQIYAMALIERLPERVASVGLNWNTQIPLAEIVKHDAFEQLIEQRNIPCKMQNNNNMNHHIGNVQDDVDSQRSYQQRKEEIDSKSTENKKIIHGKLRDLRSQIGTLRRTKLNDLVRLNTKRVEDLFEGFGEKGELARFLILEGHLDDTYYQYTSLFHSGRLSPNDNNFLIQIRAFLTPEPTFPIDNPKEVIAAMRGEDFRQSYVLNVKLVDSLLSDRALYREQVQKLFEFLSSEFENCESFFDAYYASGRHVAGLLSGLAKTWKGLVPTAISSARNISHVTQLVAGLPEKSLKTLARDFKELPDFVSANLPEILAQSPELAPERLKCLYFEVKDLSAIKEHSGILRFMFEAGLFKLTIANLEYVYKEILGENDLDPLRERNFTTIRLTNNSTLIERVDRDFERYLRDVLLELPENSREDASAILDVVQRDALNQDDLREFLKRQVTLLPTMDEVPERLHATLFKLSMIEPTWVNCLAFMGSDGFEADSLVGYLDRDDVRATILKHTIPSDQDSLQLRQFLIEAGSLSDAAYREYAHALPKSFNKLPEGLEPNKLQILIEEGKITFKKESLDALSESRYLQVQFVAANIEVYLADPDSFSLDDSFREDLLRSEIEPVTKRRIIELMDLGALAGLPERSALIGPIINKADVKAFNLDGNIAQALIAHSKPIATQISLFNKCHSLLTDDEVRYVLSNLPRPLSEIKTGYSTPKLKSSPENLDLVKWLDSRNIISSWSEGGFLTTDIKVNLKRS